MATTKQRLAVEKMLENNRSDKPKTIGEVLISAGYSPTTSTVTTQITKSKGFLEVLEEVGVTNDRLSQVMEEGLAAERDGKADHGIRHKYLETALKVKGLQGNSDTPTGNQYNTFIQQTNINPNVPDAKTLVDNTLDMLMKQTKREE